MDFDQELVAVLGLIAEYSHELDGFRAVQIRFADG
jgi:hypothetical protein